MNTSHELAERRLFDSRNNLDFTPKRSEQSWTDQRIQQIKKKYQTTHKKPQWPGSQIRSKSILQDKENQRKITRTQHKEQSKQFYVETPSIEYRSKRQNMTQSYKLGSKTNEKEVQSSIKLGYFNNNEGQSVSAFQTSDNFYMKSALNQKFQAQSSQKINYQPPIRLGTDYGLGGKFRESNPKISKRQINDHRIENIDKINSKIKHLLQCIEDCEQQERKLTNASRVDMNRSHVGRFNLDRSNISKVQLKNGQYRLQLQQTKIIQRRSFQYPAPLNNPSQSNAVEKSFPEPPKDTLVKNNSSKHFQDYLNQYKEKLNQRKSRFQVRNDVQNQSSMLRASSCIEKGRKYQYSQEHREQTDQDNSGQIELQINKFNRKIEELQQKKRKMNIQFKPFQYECSPIKKINKESQMFSSKFYQKFPHQRLKTQVQKPSSYFNKQILQREKFGAISRKEERQNIQSKAIYRFVKDSVYPQKVNLRQSNARPNTTQNTKSIIQSLDHDQKQSIVIQNIELNNNKTYDNEELRKKIGQRMQSRKKMLEMIQSKISCQQEDVLQYQNFINALCKQVCLDQELRNSKNWLSQYHNSAKYELIKSQLVKKGAHMREEQINSEFMNTNDIEYDPFFSFRQQKYTINTVVSSYLNSINFWQQKLLKNWNIQKVLKNQSLAVSLMKNEISIEDIVRLINTHSGNFYRNRDVYLIFDKMKKYLGIVGQENISLEQLKQVFGK